MSARQLGEKHGTKITIGVSAGVVLTILTSLGLIVFKAGRADHRIESLEIHHVRDVQMMSEQRREDLDAAERSRQELKVEIRDVKVDVTQEVRDGFKRLEERISK